MNINCNFFYIYVTKKYFNIRFHLILLAKLIKIPNTVYSQNETIISSNFRGRIGNRNYKFHYFQYLLTVQTVTFF